MQAAVLIVALLSLLALVLSGTAVVVYMGWTATKNIQPATDASQKYLISLLQAAPSQAAIAKIILVADTRLQQQSAHYLYSGLACSYNLIEMELYNGNL